MIKIELDTKQATPTLRMVNDQGKILLKINFCKDGSIIETEKCQAFLYNGNDSGLPKLKSETYFKNNILGTIGEIYGDIFLEGGKENG